MCVSGAEEGVGGGGAEWQGKAGFVTAWHVPADVHCQNTTLCTACASVPPPC